VLSISATNIFGNPKPKITGILQQCHGNKAESIIADERNFHANRTLDFDWKAIPARNRHLWNHKNNHHNNNNTE
jgi:hypothetical protein